MRLMHEDTGPAPAGEGKRSQAPVHAPACMEEFIPQPDWDVFLEVMLLAEERGLRFALGGGFATSFYSAHWRNTKDIDLYILPRDREAMVQVTLDAGLHDLHAEKSYDRGWIYRATGNGVIVDIIWQLANYAGEVDEAWVDRGPQVCIHGYTLRLVPPEEMIWSKIFVVQRERCDFPDIVNILYTCGAEMDWTRLLERLDGNERLLASVLSLFAWVAPGRARVIPPRVWQRLGLEFPPEGVDRDEERIRKLDSREWFSPV